MKTMQYAIYQLKWLRSRFTVFQQDTLLKLQLENFIFYDDLIKKAGEHVFKLIETYNESSIEKQSEFLKTYVKRANKRDNWVQKHCEFCNIVLNGEQEWHKHIKTKKHFHCVVVNQK
jgi:hypothetical protein